MATEMLAEVQVYQQLVMWVDMTLYGKGKDCEERDESESNDKKPLGNVLIILILCIIYNSFSNMLKIFSQNY